MIVCILNYCCYTLSYNTLYACSMTQRKGKHVLKGYHFSPNLDISNVFVLLDVQFNCVSSVPARSNGKTQPLRDI